MTDLQVLAIAGLVPHPDNPRLQLREDVVERIAAEIGRFGFGQEHALLVRPKDGAHQILSGHHRVEAATRAGLSEVPCWVKDLDDDEAFMQLVLCNEQSELSKVERAIHVFRFGERGEPGRGRRGGLSEYARRIDPERADKIVRRVQEQYAVGELVENARTSAHFISLIERDPYSHLLEITRAHVSVRSRLVEHLLNRDWSVADTSGAVEKVRKFEIPAEHAYWLPYAAVVEAYLRSDRLNPAAVAKLITTAERVLAYAAEEGTDEDGEAFRAWLRDGTGKDSWDVQKIGRYHADLIRTVAERKAAEAEAAADEPGLPDGVDLRLGDFREVLKDLDGTVDAIITDPPYPAEFLSLFGIRDGHDEDGQLDFREEGLAEIAARILKPGGICAVMVGQSYLPEIVERMTDSGKLTYHWTLAYLTPGGQAVQLWQRKVNTFWKPVLIFTKGDYAGDWIGDVVSSDVNDNDKQHHHWGQSESGMADLIGRLTKPGQLVADPFLGGGTTAVVAHALSRRIIACDIDETCVATTTARFTVTSEAA